MSLKENEELEQIGIFHNESDLAKNCVVPHSSGVTKKSDEEVNCEFFL